MKSLFEYTPRQIVKELDEYIIGQDEAKRAVAIALRNRWRRQQVEDPIRDEILPNNILMMGPTGVGKTEIARRLAKLAGAPFVKVEASKFTEVGYVGKDVEGIIRDLVDAAVAMVRSERTEEVSEIAELKVEERLLDLLLPPPSSSKSSSPKNLNDLLSGIAQQVEENGDDDDDEEDDEIDEGIEAEKAAIASERYARSREKMRERLRSGKLEKFTVELRVPEKTGGMMQVIGPIGIEEMGINLQELFGGMMPQKRKKRKVTIDEARSLLLGEEIDRLLDMDAIIAEAIDRAEQVGIVFLDEIDKIAAVEPGNGPDVSREGVQRDILPVVEGTRVTTKYGPVNSDHVLFVAAGAFHVARPSDLIPELQGRFPIRVELDPLDEKDFVKILTQPRNSLVKQYTALISAENVELTFDKAAIREIARFAATVNDRTENIGARRLHTVMTRLLDEWLFKIPNKRIKKIEVTKAMVQETLSDLVEDDDLSRYIL